MRKNTITECLLYMQNPYQVLWETKIFIGYGIHLYSVPSSLEKKYFYNQTHYKMYKSETLWTSRWQTRPEQ